MKKIKIRMLPLLCIVLTAGFCLAGASTVHAESFQITKKTASLTAGKRFQIRTNAKDHVKYGSTNAKIASVSADGKITAKRYGRTTIRVRHGQELQTFQLTVKPKKIIGVDPGHQIAANSSTEPNGPGSSVYKMKVSGGTRGVVSGKPEYQLTLEVGQALEKELYNRGYKVVMTRTTNDINISNKERAQLINEAKADAAVRIHGDGNNSASVSGVTMLCPSASNPYVGNLSKKSKKLSECILNSYIAATGLRSRGIAYRDDLTGTNWSQVPVTLIELGFMTNRSDDLYLSSKSGQKAMVQGIADGIDSYFGY